uniref:Uncharacterized protein n=1 Tax=Arundo donax TaxID=35708 RepID=A0A0A9EJV2_ARUDO
MKLCKNIRDLYRDLLKKYRCFSELKRKLISPK